MRPEQEIALAFAALFFVLVLWREIIWFRRFSAWQKAEGVVVGFRAPLGRGSGFPVVEYSVGGIPKTFVSSVCLYNPKLGETVDVLVDPKSDGAVMLTRRHRWMLTGLCVTLAFVMIGVAGLSH